MDQNEVNDGELLMSESELLEGLLAAADGKNTEKVTIKVKRGDKVLFQFRITGLSEDEVKKVRERNSIYKNNHMGIRVLKEFNDVRFRSEIIYRATFEEDRKKLWDNKEAWTRLNVLSGIDMIDKVLFSGEKDAIYEKVQLVSGYRDEEEVEETAKNS